MNVSFTDQLVEWHHQLVESSRLDALRPLRGFCCAANDFCQRILVYLRRVERLSSQPLRGPELCTVLFTAPILYISSLMGSEGLFLHTFPKARRKQRPKWRCGPVRREAGTTPLAPPWVRCDAAR